MSFSVYVCFLGCCCWLVILLSCLSSSRLFLTLSFFLSFFAHLFLIQSLVVFYATCNLLERISFTHLKYNGTFCCEKKQEKQQHVSMQSFMVHTNTLVVRAQFVDLSLCSLSSGSNRLENPGLPQNSDLFK